MIRFLILMLPISVESVAESSHQNIHSLAFLMQVNVGNQP